MRHRRSISPHPFAAPTRVPYPLHEHYTAARDRSHALPQHTHYAKKQSGGSPAALLFDIGCWGTHPLFPYADRGTAPGWWHIWYLPHLPCVMHSACVYHARYHATRCTCYASRLSVGWASFSSQKCAPVIPSLRGSNVKCLTPAFCWSS